MNKRLTQSVLASWLGLSLATGCGPAPTSPPATSSRLVTSQIRGTADDAACDADDFNVSIDDVSFDDEDAGTEQPAQTTQRNSAGPQLHIPPSDRPGLLPTAYELPPLPEGDWEHDRLSIEEELAMLESAVRLPPVDISDETSNPSGETYVAQAPPDWSLSRRLQRVREWQPNTTQPAASSTSVDEVDDAADSLQDDEAGPVRLSPVEARSAAESYDKPSSPVWNGPLERLPALSSPASLQTDTEDTPRTNAAIAPWPEVDTVPEDEAGSVSSDVAEPVLQSVPRSSVRPRTLAEPPASAEPASEPSHRNGTASGPSLSWPALDSPGPTLPSLQPTEVARQPARSAPPEPLPPVAAGSTAKLAPRPAEMDAVARKAIDQTRNGFLLSRRGALYTARTEFIGVLRLIAQAQDMRDQSNRHARALADGLRALEETNDLVPRGSQLETDIDVESVVARHRTPVGQELDLSQTSTTALLGRYYTFAQERLSTATGGEAAASMALHGMGKVHAILAREDTTTAALNEPAAMVYHQAALLVDPGNYLAANDLGVLLARYGRFAEACELLARSAEQWPQAKTYENLANVYRQMGQRDLAEKAQKESLALAQKALAAGIVDSRGSRHDVRWVSPQELAGEREEPRAASGKARVPVNRRAQLDRPPQNHRSR